MRNPRTTKLQNGENRNRLQREMDMAETSRLYLEGKTQAEIARQLGVSVVCIHRDLKKLGKRWMDKADASFDARKAEELAKLDRLERTSWEAWQRSCQNKVAKGHKDKKGVGGCIEDWEREEERDGDPRFLEVVYKCVLKRMEVLGLDAPKRLWVSGPNGGPIQHNTESDLDREIELLLAEMAAGEEEGTQGPAQTEADVESLDAALADEQTEAVS